MTSSLGRIALRVTNRSVPFHRPLLISRLRAALQLTNCAEFDVSVWLASSNTLRLLNQQYRRIDRSTDILSFPWNPKLKAGDLPVAEGDAKDLGDMVISMPHVKKQAIKYKESIDDRLIFLCVHGLLHCLGYDHIEDSDHVVMQHKETALMAELLKIREAPET